MRRRGTVSAHFGFVSATKDFHSSFREIELVESHPVEDRSKNGTPPHFSNTLNSSVAADGQSAKFEGVVTGERVCESERALS